MARVQPSLLATLLLFIYVMSVQGAPLPSDDGLSTIFDGIKDRILNDTMNGLLGGVFDRKMACRACKETVINARYALIVDKNAVSNYFTDPCTEFFPDKEGQHDCKLVIQQKVDQIYQDILGYLDAEYLCKEVLHVCPEMTVFTALDNEIQNYLPE